MASRALAPEPLTSLDDYTVQGGGAGLEAARRLGPDAVIEDIDAAGLRGRGGAGFPTGTKWRTVRDNASPVVPATVVVNAAEGEPGTFKDRAILRRDPYRVLEGALIAALAVGADRVVVALKASFDQELARVRSAADELRGAGWSEGITVDVLGGPGEYLYGEETALLEVVAGRAPFPRLAPPFRRGADELGESAQPGDAELAGPGDETVAPPSLVNNVETLANVAAILTNGPAWFREVGTDESPGTVVCTVSGRTARDGVGEVPMGTPLAQVIDEVGGGLPPGRRVLAVLSGVANPLLPGDRLDAPVSYEGMRAAGTGLGAAGFLVFDDATDLAAVAHGVSRFLAVESCGQCTPCKQDGLALADLFDRLRQSEADESVLDEIASRTASVSDQARCYLALQHQAVIDSLLRLFPDHLRRHVGGDAGPARAELIAPIVDLVGERAILDDRHAGKQPDWTYGETWSGKSPVDLRDQDAHAPPAG